MNRKWENTPECKEKFIELANNFWHNYKRYIPEVHNYNYDNTITNKYKDNIIVHCNLHGDFTCQMKSFLEGHGCKECAKLNRNASHKFTNDDIINKGKQLYGDTLDYSEIDRNNLMDNNAIKLTCKIHGVFYKSINKFLNGQGCPTCARILGRQKSKYNTSITTDICIKKLKERFGDLYDYSLVSCNTQSDNITLICKIHGPFQINVAVALRKQVLCPDCCNTNEILLNDYLYKCKKKFGDLYDYSKIEYHVIQHSNKKAIYLDQNITVICKEHGKFIINARKHISRNYHGCPKCKLTYNPTNDEFIQICKNKWGNLYDYSKTKYQNKYTTIIIGCKEHGFVEISPKSHLNGKTGCPICSGHTIQNTSFKFSLLQQYDLLNMSPFVIMDLIGIDKLPNDFTQLCRFGEGTESRKKAIEKLVSTYGLESDTDNETETEDTTNDTLTTTTEFTSTSEDTYGVTTEEETLKTFKEIEEIDKIIKESVNEKTFSTGDKYQYIIADEMSKLWNIVLREDESGSTETIDKIKNQMYRTITPFKKHLFTKFINEYNSVVSYDPT